MMSINLSDFAILDIHGVDYDDDKLFLCYNCPTKDVWPYFQPGPLSEILTIAISQKPRAGLKPGQNVSSDFDE